MKNRNYKIVMVAEKYHHCFLAAELPPQRRSLVVRDAGRNYRQIHFCCFPFTYFIMHYRCESNFLRWEGLQVFFREEPFRTRKDRLSIFPMSNVDYGSVCLGDAIHSTVFRGHRKLVDTMVSAFFSTAFETDSCHICFKDGSLQNGLSGPESNPTFGGISHTTTHVGLTIAATRAFELA